MKRRSLLAVGVAIAGFVLVWIGIQRELIHVGSMYEGTIDSGWGKAINHEERLLVGLAALGAVGTVVSTRWKSVAVVPVATGGVGLFYTFRAISHYAQNPGLYTEVTTASGRTTRYVLGAEPFLLVAGGILLVVAGIASWKLETTAADPPSRVQSIVQD